MMTIILIIGDEGYEPRMPDWMFTLIMITYKFIIINACKFRVLIFLYLLVNSYLLDIIYIYIYR